MSLEKTMFLNYPPETRSKYLGDNADKIEKKSYMKSFSTDELDQRKDDLAEACIQLDKFDQEKKDFMDVLKLKTSEFREMKKKCLTELKQGAEFVEDEICYKYIDQDGGLVGWYNADGLLIDQRKIKPEKRQGNIFKLQTGTND